MSARQKTMPRPPRPPPADPRLEPRRMDAADDPRLQKLDAAVSLLVMAMPRPVVVEAHVVARVVRSK